MIDKAAGKNLKRVLQLVLGIGLIAGGASRADAQASSVQSSPAVGHIEVADLQAACDPSALQSVASTLSVKVTVQQLPKNEIPGPFLPGGAKFTAAQGIVPDYCQVTGSFVTNPKTGRTANFLATLPSSWNQKYLQLGCAGHCGTFAVGNAASAPTITISMQGKPWDSIEKGYASFSTDEGHAGFYQGKWAVDGTGKIDDDALEDFLYRADKMLAKVGKEFTKSFYAKNTGTSRSIRYSYFCGCSGGGRDALVAASYFPEEFDGIVVGSPYANLADLAFLTTGASLAAARSEGAKVPAALVAQIDPIVKAKCDAADGVKDGLIQNPMACNFIPERDLPQCMGDKPGDNCFTKAQIETVSVVLSAVTDEHGKVVQPGYSVSDLQAVLMTPPQNPSQRDPWPDNGNPAVSTAAGVAPLSDAVIRIFTHRDDPEFKVASIISYNNGGKGSVTDFHVVVPSAEVTKANEALKMGIGSLPENAAKLLKLNHKMLIWANFSDQLLTPYMSVNYYKQLAAMYGGYNKLQKNVRLFGLPGTAHCSGGGTGGGPGSFDALSAMEDWVEKGQGPDTLVATLYPATQYGVAFDKPATRTMPLCKFPEMAHYSDHGDINDASNWSCPANDKSLLTIGESGRQAGITK